MRKTPPVRAFHRPPSQPGEAARSSLAPFMRPTPVLPTAWAESEAKTRRPFGLVGTHIAELKHEDGLRVERLVFQCEESVTATLVVDGHGGHKAAALVVDELFQKLVEHVDNLGGPSSDNLQEACTSAFAELHERITSPEFASSSGTTATLIIINEVRGEVTCCSVGDSFAILVTPPTSGYDGESRNARASELTWNPRIENNAAERKRILDAGGKVGRAKSFDGGPSGPLRAWPGGVACASALGDADCGSFISAMPNCCTKPMPTAPGAKVVLASDGLWDALSFAEVAKVALQTRDPAAAAERLVRKAVRGKGLRDDVSDDGRARESPLQ